MAPELIGWQPSTQGWHDIKLRVRVQNCAENVAKAPILAIVML